MKENSKSVFIKCSEMYPSYLIEDLYISDGCDRDFFKSTSCYKAISTIKDGNKVVGYKSKKYLPDCAIKESYFSVSLIKSFNSFYQFGHKGTLMKFIGGDSIGFKDKFFEGDFNQLSESIDEAGCFDDFIFLEDGLCEDSSIDECEVETDALEDPFPLPLAIRKECIVMVEESYDVNLKYTRIKMNDGTTLKCKESVFKVLSMIEDEDVQSKHETREPEECEEPGEFGDYEDSDDWENG